jgi:hypothetical protein
MRIEQGKWTQAHGWSPQTQGTLREVAQLVLLFGAKAILKEQKLIEQIKNTYPGAHILGCSTAGEIAGTQVSDDSLVADD